MTNFILDERASQSEFFNRTLPADVTGYGGYVYRLQPAQAELNLAPGIRKAAQAYFKAKGITWHQHANHALSSQVSCLNFLMPLAMAPELLAHIIGRVLNIIPPTVLEIEDGPDGRPWFVGFEWIGRADYLNEGGKSGHRTRGANATSADAIVRFRHDGRVETLLIEWKYTERYRAPIPPAGNEVRVNRHKDLAFAPNGPIRCGTGLSVTDFFWEPFYQMLRQQMLAFQMEKAREDGSERVRVLHISPKANRALHVVTAPTLQKFGTDAFDVFRSLLADESCFISRTTEAVFGALLAGAEGIERVWADYLLDRYKHLSTPALDTVPSSTPEYAVEMRGSIGQ